jgi:hypothetical protein
MVHCCLSQVQAWIRCANQTSILGRRASSYGWKWILVAGMFPMSKQILRRLTSRK